MHQILSSCCTLLSCCLLYSSIVLAEDENLAKLRTDLYSLKDEFDIPAMAIVLVDARRMLMLDVVGLADRESGKAADTNTIFRIGSITKMFTATAILTLQEAGALNIDMDVKELTPDIPIRNPWDSQYPVTLAQLLEHTSGLPGLSKEEFDHNTPMSLQQALNWKADERIIRWPPGMHFSYTNAGAGLAEYIIEKRSGQSYESFLKQRIFEPLGMTSASLHDDRATLSALASGYDADGHSVIPYWHMLFRSFGAINLKPRDMVPFLQLLINEGLHDNKQLLAKSSIRRMETPTTSLAARSGMSCGYGLGNYTSERNGLLFHGHGGDADGYLSRLGYNRDTGLGYFVVINAFKNNALLKIRHRVEDFISQGFRQEVPIAFQLEEATLRTYAGEYQSVTSRFPGRLNTQNSLNVSLNEGNLMLKSGKNEYQLIPVNARHFRRAGESVACHAFVVGPGKQIYLQSELGNFARVSGSFE